MAPPHHTTSTTFTPSAPAGCGGAAAPYNARLGVLGAHLQPHLRPRQPPSPLPQAAGASGRPPLAPDAFKRRLAGPILSLPTTFHADLSVNYDAVGRMVRRARRFGVRIFELTAGNSKYHVLSYDEIKGVTRAMVEAAGGIGLTIAATGPWPAEQSLEYARFAESLGADAVQVLLPEGLEDHSSQEAEDALVQHFEAIAAGTRLAIVLHGIYTASVMRRLVAIDSVVAMKEDGELTFYIDRIIEFGGQIEIFSGGAENRFLVGYPYGAKAGFSTLSGFAPDIPMRFWRAIRERDLARAVEITTAYDHPFIARFTHEFWHASLEFFGVAERHMREPFRTISEEEMGEVAEFWSGLGVDPKDYLDAADG